MNRLKLYTRVSERVAGIVINEYSTSFALASRLLTEPVRQQVANIYALVRVADEIVDGASDGAGLTIPQADEALTELENQVYAALETGFSTNPIVHAYAQTARATGFGEQLVRPFFESMRCDLTQYEHDQESFDRYVYGSAEVIGLMCLQSFLAENPPSTTDREKMVTGARALGAAFQKVNFLRDLADDYQSLGRSYFPGVEVDQFSEADKARILEDINTDLTTSRDCLALLPASSRRAVCLAQSLFGELTVRLAATPAEKIMTTRISVPNSTKLRLAAAAYSGRLPK